MPEMCAPPFTLLAVILCVVTCAPVGPVQGFSGGRDPRCYLGSSPSRETSTCAVSVRLPAHSVCPFTVACGPGAGCGWPLRLRAAEALLPALPSERPTQGHSDGQVCLCNLVPLSSHSQQHSAKLQKVSCIVHCQSCEI